MFGSVIYGTVCGEAINNSVKQIVDTKLNYFCVKNDKTNWVTNAILNFGKIDQSLSTALYRSSLVVNHLFNNHKHFYYINDLC